MSNSTTLLDTISSTQANKEVVVNALLDAASPSMLWGRHASACSGLTWGYYGGSFVDSTGTLHTIANGTVTLTASTTNYLQANPTTGAISANTTGFTAGQVPLYSIVTGTTTVTSYTDCRSYQPSATAGGGGGSGTVTSVGLVAPAEFTVSGSPVTTSGTLTLTKVAQAINLIYAGPATGSSAAPTFRALVAADLPVMAASGASHAAGAVPDPGATAGATRFLREDATWQVPTSSGGSSTLAGLTDVNITEGAGIDGFSLKWNNATGKWIASASSGGGTYAALTDVSLVSLADVQLPVYSASAAKWKNRTLTLTPLSLDAWNASDKASFFSLSADSLTATTNTTNSNTGFLRGNVGHSSGQWVFEYSFNSSNPIACGVATASDAVSGTVPGLSDSTGCLLRSSDANALYGTAAHSGSVATSNNVAVMVAVDITAGLVWFRASNGNWNNSGTANPATGAGGYPISAGLIYFPCFCIPVSFTGAGTTGTLNTGASPFTNTPPSGFSAWNANDNPGIQPSDVAVASPSSGQVLTYNGSKWINAAKQRVSSVTYASTVTLDCSTADVFEITLTGNITINFSNGTDGQKVTVTLTQDGTGSRTVTWGAGVGFGSDITSAVASTAASKIDYFELRYNGAATKYHMVSVARGY